MKIVTRQMFERASLNLFTPHKERKYVVIYNALHVYSILTEEYSREDFETIIAFMVQNGYESKRTRNNLTVTMELGDRHKAKLVICRNCMKMKSIYHDMVKNMLNKAYENNALPQCCERILDNTDLFDNESAVLFFLVRYMEDYELGFETGFGKYRSQKYQKSFGRFDVTMKKILVGTVYKYTVIVIARKAMI